MESGRAFLGVSLGKVCHGKFTMTRAGRDGNVTEAAVQIPMGFLFTCFVNDGF